MAGVMTDRQKLFCNEYLIDMNATRAYKAAYPSVKRDATASQSGSRLLRNVNVKAYVANQLKQMEDAKIADAAEVMKYLTSVMRGESTAEVVVVEGCGEGVSEARRMDKAPDEKERLKAAELLAKRYGLNVCKLEVSDNTEQEKKLDAMSAILEQMKPVKEGD